MQVVRGVEFPEKLRFLFQPKRFKVAWGGRGSAKSWSFGRALLILAAGKKLRILCAREVQDSIKDSVHALLKDQIAMLGLGHLFDVQESRIRCPQTGSEFLFTGLSTQTAESIKSFEGVDIVWVEEGRTVTKRSWGILIPTIRKDGSEIWVTFNPEMESDDTYQRFVVNTRDDAIVVKVNWDDNPWFPAVLEAERRHCQQFDPDNYDHIWGGNCKPAVDGAIYYRELVKAEADGRVRLVPHDPMLPVDTAWDLGVHDETPIWFVQSTGAEIRIIDFYFSSGVGLDHYAKVLREKGYNYGQHIAPPDIEVRELGSGRSRKEIAASLGINFTVLPPSRIEDGINAVRMMFPRCYFDKDKTFEGRQRLGAYRRELNTRLDEFKPMPVHDWASHAADAFRYLAMHSARLTGGHVGQGLKPINYRKRYAS